MQINGELIEVTNDYQQEPKADIHILPDLPGYESPVSGLWIEGRAARREDMKRHGARPWEGLEQERKEADRQKAYQAAAYEKKLDEAAWRAYNEMSPEKRRILRNA